MPVELRRSYRRIAGYMSSGDVTPEVRSAYDAFSSAVIAKASEAELEALFTHLEDAYDNTR